MITSDGVLQQEVRDQKGAEYHSLKDAEARLDSQLLRDLRRIYGSTQKRKEARIAGLWGGECVEELGLDDCSDYLLGFMLRVARSRNDYCLLRLPC